MKNVNVIGGVALLGVGFAAGWIAKPSPVSDGPAVVAASAVRSGAKASTAAPVEETSATAAAAQPKRPQRGEGAAAEKPNGPSAEQMEQGRKMQSEMSKAMVKRMRDKFGNHIGKLAENLNLTPEQKLAVEKSLDEQMAKLETIDFMDRKSMEQLPDLTKSLTNKFIEDQLASSLSEDQKTAMVAFKEREHRSKVDTKALKGLSKLQGVVEFEEGQRDKVYEVLAENAESSVADDDGSMDMTSMFTEGMGIEMDPYDLGLQKALTETVGDPMKFSQNAGDQKEIAAKLRETFDQRIEDKVEQLRPVLNEKQLEQYRAELKTKGVGIYGTMLMGMEANGAGK